MESRIKINIEIRNARKEESSCIVEHRDQSTQLGQNQTAENDGNGSGFLI